MTVSHTISVRLSCKPSTFDRVKHFKIYPSWYVSWKCNLAILLKECIQNNRQSTINKASGSAFIQFCRSTVYKPMQHKARMALIVLAAVLAVVTIWVLMSQQKTIEQFAPAASSAIVNWSVVGKKDQLGRSDLDKP